MSEGYGRVRVPRSGEGEINVVFPEFNPLYVVVIDRISKVRLSGRELYTPGVHLAINLGGLATIQWETEDGTAIAWCNTDHDLRQGDSVRVPKLELSYV